jgi:hypothetical protein
MMARSSCSNQRPDTLMQDRISQIDEIFLQRTAGPYIRVNLSPQTIFGECPVCPP